jgi:hypothetical protein
MSNIPELPPIFPYLNGPHGRWDHAQANWANRAVASVAGDPEKTATILTQFIFETHPDVLDLPPATQHRLEESTQVMRTYVHGEELLTESVLGHYEQAAQKFQNGFTTAQTATIVSADAMRSGPIIENGMLIQKVDLPESVQQKALRWNQWAQRTIKDEGMEALFTAHPNWVGAKLGDGSWLPVGNLMVEVVEGLGRIRTPQHQAQQAEEHWGIGATSNEWGNGLDQWFVMTHIMDKELLFLASRLGQNMIDGMRLTPETYAKSYIPIRQIMEQNPQLAIRGVLSDGTWAYSSDLFRLFPQQPISGLHDIAGDVLDVGSAADLGMHAQIEFATHDAERREAFLKGLYDVRIASRFIDYEAMGDVLRSVLRA